VGRRKGATRRREKVARARALYPTPLPSFPTRYAPLHLPTLLPTLPFGRGRLSADSDSRVTPRRVSGLRANAPGSLFTSAFVLSS
jgi:hypothetical protein